MTMSRSASLAALGMIVVLPLVAAAQGACPPDVQAAKDMLKATPPRAASTTPKAAAGARGQEAKAPKAGQEAQASAGATATKGRGTTLATAERLIREAESACILKEDARAAANARAAMELLKYLQQ